MRLFRIAVLVTGLVAAPTVLMAAQVSDKPTGATQTIKVSKALDLLNALTAIAGTHEVVVGQGGSARVAQIPYDLSSDTIWALTDDINVLRRLVETAQADQKHLIAQAEAKNGGPLHPKSEAVYDANHNVVVPELPSDAQLALNKQVQDLMDSEREIPKLFHVKRDDLKKALSGDGHFPGGFLASLEPIVDP